MCPSLGLPRSDPRGCGREPGHPVAGSHDPPTGCGRRMGTRPDAAAPHDVLGAILRRIAGTDDDTVSQHPDGMVELPFPGLLIGRHLPEV